MYRLLLSRISLAFLFLVLLPACVSKKKHLEALHTLATTYQTELEEKTTRWATQLNASRDSNLHLRLNVAERKGENNALVAMQDKLQGRIDQLKEQIENQGLQSQTSTQNLSQEISKKEQEIKRLQGLLTQVDDELEKHLTTLGSLANDIRVGLGTLPADQFSIETSNIKIKVSVSESLLFKPKTTTSVIARSEQILGTIAATLQKYPSMNVAVTGHTDNKAPRNKGYKDNWTVSAVRAAVLTGLLTSDHGLGPNQVIAAGKGEFAPQASNETSDGREQNRRVEFIIQPRPEDLVSVLQRITKEK